MGAEQTDWLWNELAGSCPSPLERAASQSRHCDGSAFWLLTTPMDRTELWIVRRFRLHVNSGLVGAQRDRRRLNYT